MMARTTYYGPTDRVGSRIRVTDGWHRRTYPYPYEASNAHQACAERFAVELLGPGASARWVRETRSGAGNVYEITVGGES